MKIGFFTNTYLPISYGSVTSVRNFRRGLEELGHEVHIFTPNVKGYHDEETNIHRTPSWMYGYKIKYPLAYPWTKYPHKIAKKIGFDIIHCHQPYTVGYYGVNIGKELGIPVVFTHHCRYEGYVHYMPPILPRKLLEWLVIRSATKYANKCQYVITPTKTIEELIKARGVHRPITVIPTGIEWQRFQEADREKTRKELGVTPDEILMVSNGRIDEEKNIQFLIDALFPMIKKSDKLKMIFVGEGSLQETVKTKAQQLGINEKIIFAGLVPQQEVQYSYAAGDVFVQSSLTETQGMSLLEAMASGLAVVAVNATGSSDQVENNKSGILTKNNKREYAAAVKCVISDVKLRQTLAKQARMAARECDYRKRTEELVEVYNKALKSENLL